MERHLSVTRSRSRVKLSGMINLLVFDSDVNITHQLAGKASPDHFPAENASVLPPGNLAARRYTNPVHLGGMRSLATPNLVATTAQISRGRPLIRSDCSSFPVDDTLLI